MSSPAVRLPGNTAPGAVRTLERLLGVCRTSYYRRYAKYLGRTAVGLHAEGIEER